LERLSPANVGMLQADDRLICRFEESMVMMNPAGALELFAQCELSSQDPLRPRT